MTWSKYGRLLIVLFVPLVLAGVATFFVYWNKTGHQYAWYLCNAGDNPALGCRYLGGEGEESFRDSVDKENPNRFDIMTFGLAEHRFVSNFLEGSGGYIANATVLSSTTNLGYANIENGKQAIINLGKVEEKPPTTYPMVLFSCNQLSFERTPNTYQALCYSNGWSGSVTFFVDPGLDPSLRNLKRSVEYTIEDRYNGFVSDLVLCSLMYVLLFLALSGLAWLIVQSGKYVMRG